MLNKNHYYYPNIKLLGNSRYRYSSPLLFVEDQKIIADKSFGLIPIPLEKYKRKEIIDENDEDEKNLYELQRSIVMTRRYQYNKKNINNKKKQNIIYFNNVIIIQKWWKNLYQKN